jgi:hypothetical protein
MTKISPAMLPVLPILNDNSLIGCCEVTVVLEAGLG